MRGARRAANRAHHAAAMALYSFFVCFVVVGILGSIVGAPR